MADTIEKHTLQLTSFKFIIVSFKQRGVSLNDKYAIPLPVVFKISQTRKYDESGPVREAFGTMFCRSSSRKSSDKSENQHGYQPSRLYDMQGFDKFFRKRA